MEYGKILRQVAVLVAVVAAFVDIPEGAAIIALLGLTGGYFIEEDYSQRFLIGALALALAHGALGPIWVVGEHLTAVLGSVSSLFNAAACTVIVMGLVKRLKP
mgnify:CR=1 FL=1